MITYRNLFENVHDSHTFLEEHNLPKLTGNILKTIKNSNYNLKFSFKKTLGSDDFTGECH